MKSAAAVVQIVVAAKAAVVVGVVPAVAEPVIAEPLAA